MWEQYVVKFPGLPYFWGYFIKPCCFSILNFFSTESSSSCVNCPSLKSNWLLIIFVIGSCVIFGCFPSKFTKCCFHKCICSSWLVAFCLAFAVLFLLLTTFTVCHAILDCLSSTESLILWIWFCIYSVCSFSYMLIYFVLSKVSGYWLGSSFVFGSGFHVCALFLTPNISHETLGLTLCLVGMHSAAAFKWALMKFSYSSFRVGVSDISCCASNLFLSVNVFLRQLVRKRT